MKAQMSTVCIRSSAYYVFLYEYVFISGTERLCFFTGILLKLAQKTLTAMRPSLALFFQKFLCQMI